MTTEQKEATWEARSLMAKARRNSREAKTDQRRMTAEAQATMAHDTARAAGLSALAEEAHALWLSLMNEHDRQAGVRV